MVEHKLLSSDRQIAARGHGGLQKKKKRSSTSCCNEITSARSVEAYVIHLCAEFHVFLYGRDCAKRCVNCAKGSKQLRCRARAQLTGNIGSKCAKSHCIMFNASKSMDMIFHEQFSKYFYA